MANPQQQFNDFTLAPDGYAAFDALSLKSLIINRLNAGNIITDQNFEGSNMSSIIDIIAYSYHVLLFYLNSILDCEECDKNGCFSFHVLEKVFQIFILLFY